MKINSIVYIIGHHYTSMWLKEKNNPKLEGFRTGAEQCLQDFLAHNSLPKVGVLLIIMAGFLLGYSTSFSRAEHGLTTLAAVFAIIGTILLLGAKKNRPGETTQELARAWRSVRGELFDLGIFERIRLQTKGDSREYLDDVETRMLLVAAFGEEMESLSRELRETEREGWPQKVALLERKMKDLRALTLKMGLHMNYDKYFLERLHRGEIRIMTAEDRRKIRV